ncbi:hypothetical protein [uncultured Exiguobacterium sp.]|uniref:hypothetical protein n=1 Tax=uncultured Exiguobacterium sp. TaxID=202669 RepID=UPI0025E44634|nr:hypothetical protein [uncultured Exiguobacterium sp.]
MKKLIGTIVTVYLLLSVPSLLGIGRVIDWVPEATTLQIIHVTVVEALTEDFFLKSTIAITISLFIRTFLIKRTYT